MSRITRIITTLSILLLMGGIFTAANSQSAFNRQINYQGKLTNASGVPVADGTYNIAFRLYTTAASATTTNIWEELDTSTNKVQVTGGLFSVLLGSTTPLTSVNFNQTLYLGVEIGSTTTPPTWDGEMTPRKKLGAVPAAFEADKLDGLDSAQFLRSDAVNSTTTASNWLTFTNNSTGNIAVFTGSGNVGIGTTSPYAKLSISANQTDTNGTLFAIASSTGGTATTTLFSVNSAGNVGIGTNPSAGFSLAAASAIVGSKYQASGNGAANSPVYTFSNNNTTGLFAVTGGNLGFSANGAEGMRLISNGNVGIGTTSPYAKLSISANQTDTNGTLFAIASSTGGTATTTLFSVDNAGNTIHTASSTTNMFVVGSNGITNPLLTLGMSGTGNTAGLNITQDVNNLGVNLIAIGSGANQRLMLSSKGTGVVILASPSNSGSVSFGIGASSQTRLLLNSTLASFLPGARTGGATDAFTWTGAADTALTANSEVFDVNFNLNRTKTHANGTVATQRDFIIQAPSHAFTSFSAANNFGDLSTFSVTGAPSTSSNGTTTNAHTIFLGASTLNASTTNSYGLTVNANTGAQNNYAAQFLGGNVGIGTTNPAFLLDVGSAANPGDIRVRGTIGSTPSLIVGLTDLGGADFSINNVNGDLRIDMGTTANAFFIKNSNGNVGIGTTSPYAKLSVVGQTVAEFFTATSTTATSTFNGGLAALADMDIGSNSRWYQNGQSFMTSSTTAAGNLTFGYQTASALDANGAVNNTYFGYQAGQVATSTSSNTGIGYRALKSVVFSGGDNGTQNTAVGSNSLTNNTIGKYNTAIGASSLSANTTGSFNTANGYGTLLGNSSGGNNSAFGYRSLQLNNTGSSNMAIGYFTLNANTTGNGNTALGYQAGHGDGTTQDQRSVVDTFMTFLGYQSSRDASVASTTVLTNGTAIGKNARVGCSNCLVLGGTGADGVNIGIGTTSPYAKLTVWGQGTGTGQAFEIANNASTTLLSVLDSGVTNIGANAASTTISNLLTGSINFEDGAGVISAMNMPVTSAANGTVQSFSFGFNSGSSTPLTVYGVANGSGGTTGNAVGIATSSPWRTLSVNGTVAMDGLTASSTGNALCIMSSKEVSDAGGGTCTPSSIRFKENVETLAGGFAIDELKKLTVVSFDYKDGAYSPEDLKGAYGMIAEDVEKIDPKLVDYDYAGKPLTLKFEKFIGLLVQAVQELVARVTGLEDKFNAQQAEIDALKTRVNALDLPATGTQAGGQTAAAVVAAPPPAPVVDPASATEPEPPVTEPEPVVVSATTPSDPTATP